MKHEQGTHLPTGNIQQHKKLAGISRKVSPARNEVHGLWGVAFSQTCKQCHSQDVVRYSAARTGTVTEIWPQVPLVRLSGFSALSRRHVALISLDDGLALEAEVIDIDAEAAKPGLRVEMTIRRLRRDSNGLWLYGYKFREMKTTTVEGASNAET